MFEFSDNYLHRKAMKRALFEVDMELAEKQQASVSSVQNLREHKTIVEAESYRKAKLNSALSKPQTEAVDMKNFKDWRNINKKEISKPFPPKNRFTFGDTDDDEGEQPEINGPLSTNKNDLVARIEKLNSKLNNKEKEEKDTSIASFFKEKYSKGLSQPVTPVVPVENKSEKQEESVQEKPAKISLNDLIKRKREEESKTEIVKEEDTEERKVKVEIVDFNEDKKPEPKPEKPKKVVNRKPRGKNKRKFDPDVISSVDWK